MKKRGKKLMLMAVILLALIGGGLLAMQLNPENEATESEEESTIEATDITDFERSDVSTLSWTVDGQTLSFHLEDELWIYDEDADFPADQDSLTALISNILDLSSYYMVENVTDLAEYGLDEPSCTIQLGGNIDLQVLFGDMTPMDSLRYVSIGDGNVYMTDSSLLSEYAVNLMDLAELEDVPSMSDILTIEINRAEEQLVLERREALVTDADGNESSEYHWYSILADGETELDSSLASEFSTTVSGLVWNGCTTYKVAEEEMSLYGLAEPSAELVICYNNTDGALSVFSAQFGSTEDGSCYGRIPGSDRVYSISSDYLDTLLNTSAESLLPSAETTVE